MSDLCRKKDCHVIHELVIIALAVLVLVVVYSCSVRDFFLRQAYSYVQQNANSSRNQIDSLVKHGLESAKLTSFMISKAMTEKNLENEQEVLDSFLEKTPFTFLQFVDSSGKNNMNGIYGGYPFSAGNREYFTEGIKGNVGVWANFHPKVSKSAILDFYAPIYFDGEISGVLVGGINAEEVVKTLLEADFYGKSTTNVLYDSNFNVICSNYPTVKYGSNLRDLENCPAVDVLVENVRTGDESGFKFKYNGNEHFGCVVKLKNVDWYLVQILSKEATQELNAKTTFFFVFLIIVFCVLIVCYVLKMLHFRKITEKLHVNIINALCTSFQNVYVVNLKTGGIFIYQLTERIQSKFGKKFANGSYDENFELYEESEVYPEDKWLFEKVNKITRIREFLKNQNEFSFVYRVKSASTGGKIHFFQCYFIRPEKSDEFVVTFKNVDDLMNAKEKIDNLMEAQSMQLQIISSISGIYLTLHLIDLQKDSIVEFNTTKRIRNFINKIDNAAAQLKNAMRGVCSQNYLDAAEEFVDLETLKTRMKGKKYISVELNGPSVGWFRASFILVEKGENDFPKKVLFATQEINNEKRREEVLISDANTDELTKLFNRHAYENELREIENQEKAGNLKDDFAYISLDLNGLKNANDTLGHAAGDELLRGAAACIKSAFGSYGKIFRTGGDEFQLILFASSEQLERAEKDFDCDCENWSGKRSKSLSVSYGVVTKAENPKRQVSAIIKLADKRMYKAKSEYYLSKGIDRRGTRDAMEILCQTYTKILKIDLLRDLFSVIQIEEDEKDSVKNYDGIASKWIREFGNSDLIGKSGRAEFLSKTNFENLKKYFSNGENVLSFSYSRKIHGEFKKVQLEIIKSPEFAEKNEVVYFFVREA